MKFLKTLLVALIFITSSNNFASALYSGPFSTYPRTNNGEKWRIGYYEGGHYDNYPRTLTAIVDGLSDLGWIEPANIPAGIRLSSSEIWTWLADNVRSRYIEFPKNAYYTAKWDDASRLVIREELMNRFKERGDIDLMIAAGTKAGLALVSRPHETPTIVVSSSDPVGSGIIKSAADSGRDHVNAHVVPDHYKRQLIVFHNLVNFKKLGMAYENSLEGRTYAAVDIAEKLARERGFRILECHTRDEVPDVKIAVKSVKKCFKKLAPSVDAFYVTIQNGINPDSIPELVKILNSSRIPTFAMKGPDEVKAGFLMSIARPNFKDVGIFHAKTMAGIFNGAKPRQLPQMFEPPSKIAINLKTAEIIGYNPPVDILMTADEIFHDIPSH